MEEFEEKEERSTFPLKREGAAPTIFANSEFILGVGANRLLLYPVPKDGEETDVEMDVVVPVVVDGRERKEEDHLEVEDKAGEV